MSQQVLGETRAGSDFTERTSVSTDIQIHTRGAGLNLDSAHTHTHTHREPLTNFLHMEKKNKIYGVSI